MLSVLQNTEECSEEQRHSSFLRQLEKDNNLSLEQLKMCILNFCSSSKSHYEDAILIFEFLRKRMPSSLKGDLRVFNAIVMAYISDSRNNESALELFNSHSSLDIDLDRASLSAGILAARHAQDVESMWRIYEMADEMTNVVTAFTHETVMQTQLAFLWKSGWYREVIRTFDKERMIGRMSVDETMVSNVITSHGFLRQPVEALAVFDEFDGARCFSTQRWKVGMSMHLSLLKAFNHNGLWEEIIRFFQRWVFRKIPIAQEALAFNYYLQALLQLRWYQKVFEAFDDPYRRYQTTDHGVFDRSVPTLLS